MCFKWHVCHVSCDEFVVCYTYMSGNADCAVMWNTLALTHIRMYTVINAFLWPYLTLPRKTMSLLFATWQMCVLYVCKTGKADYSVACNTTLKTLLIGTRKVSLVPTDDYSYATWQVFMWHTTVYIWTIVVKDDAVLCHMIVSCVTRHIILQTYYYINNYIANASCTKMSTFAVKYTKLHTAAFL